MRIERLSLSLFLFFALAPVGLAQSDTPQQAKPKTGTQTRTSGAKKAPQAAVTDYKNLKYPPLNEVKVPEPARFELPNGLVVYLVEDRELPMINASAMIRAGSRWEPMNKAGLAAITGTVMRTGGTASRSGDKLDEELDRLAAIVETAIGDASGEATVSVLKEDIDKGLSILADLLQNPAFPEEKIDLAKIEQRDAIARRNDDAGSIASREFARVIYGKDSAYGHQPEYDAINSITRADLVAFHQQFFQPENVVLGVWGDFKADEMRAKIEKAFGGWARGGRPKPAVPEVEAAAQKRGGLYAINKDDVNQSTVLIGHLGGKRNDPDFYALSLANIVLGGGFASRLVSNVRTDQGLAYAVSSNWAADWDHPGLFLASGGTKSETTTKIVNSIKHEIEKLRDAGVTDNELTRAKDSILKGFAFEFDSTGKIVQRLMSYEYYGYPRDYLQRYRENIEKVTKADIQRVAKQSIQPDRFVVLVLGNQKDFDQPLSSLGQVTALDITIPNPKTESVAAATPESMAKGKQILGGALNAMGGAAIRAVKDYTTTANLTISTPQGEIGLKREVTIKLPGKLLDKTTLPFGEVIQAFDGQGAWLRTPQGTQDVPASQRGEFEGLLFRDTISLLQNIESNNLTIQALGPSEVEGKPVETVVVLDPARKSQVKLYLDPKTNLLVKKSYTAALMGAPGEVDEIYADYRDISGVKIPFKTVLNQNGKKLGEQTVTAVKINSGVDDSVFKKP